MRNTVALISCISCFEKSSTMVPLLAKSGFSETLGSYIEYGGEPGFTFQSIKKKWLFLFRPGNRDILSARAPIGAFTGKYDYVVISFSKRFI